MKKRQRSTSLRAMAGLAALAVGLAATAAGCGKAEEPSGSAAPASSAPAKETAVAKKPMTGTVKFLFPNDRPAGQDGVTKALEEKLKKDGLEFKLDFTFVPMADYGNRSSLVAASGEDYDFAWAHINGFSDAVAKKQYAPLTQALKTYGTEIMKSTPEYVFREVTFGGDIYALPRVVPSAQNDWVLSARGDWRKKYNVPEIKTVADVEKYAEALKANEKETIPLSLGYRELIREYGPTFHFLGGSTYVYVDMTDKDLKVKAFWESEAYRSIVNKFWDWSQKGYVAKDVKMLKYGTNEFIAGKIGTNYGNVMYPTEKIDRLKGVAPAGEIETVMLNPDKPKYLQTACDNLMAVFAQSKRVNEAIAFMNWVRASQENYDLFTIGVKGVNYELNGEALDYSRVTKENSYYPISYAWTDVRFQRYSANVPASYIDTIKNWDKGAIQSPLLGIVLDKTQVKETLAKLQTVYDQYAYPIEKGLMKFDDKKDEMMKKAKDAGLDLLIADTQKQVDAFVKAKK